MSRVEEISELLFRDWNPLGVHESPPADDDETHAEHIDALLGQGASSSEIGAYLSRVRATSLLMPPDREADRRIAQLIEALR